MAAYRAGVKKVLIPADNVSDLYEVEDVVKAHIQFVPVERIDQVLQEALDKQPEPAAEALASTPLLETEGKAARLSTIYQ